MTKASGDDSTQPDFGANNALAPSQSPEQPQRLASIDAYRGLVMFLMMAEVLELLRRGAASCQVTASGNCCAITSRTSSGWAARCTT